MSGKHFEIAFGNGRLVLTDMSTNGTCVNGMEVGFNKTCMLQDGDVITLLVPSTAERDEEFGHEIPVRKPP